MGLTLQWLAGFFDGEGCITLYGKGLYPRMTLTNTYLPILKAIQAQFGGHLGKTSKSSARQCYVLTWQCKKMITLLKVLTPFLTVKKAQAELVIMAYDTFKRDGRKLSDTIIANRVQLQSQITELKKEQFIQ